ncbi:MAG: aminofutalosine synthase MqnE [Pseudodesulfovibrio sp.]|uniref:Aminodeoxyfutalosine synthase n=1 Tax=Pseudodesulfovibrio aespoeensis (strain ATCC 700646 / DSM 10631 / Aspo-2) TaxID=643562 RepID=E6VT70_PSEA9|nr:MULTISPECIES: aminofutalosine synthase MqnE [Pseudodesulfovibrio]MBU4192062.1 aminofutalosine synthase MqnE [Pseudomonadota bacterium]ADU63229.1 Radical SAM domain protein [Pseudodesulfovibrio aespoeensis Aspo-2]MBU4244461.1 aminofutalosine synthase MqnE [Pseudomonadota bacterium]MBU4377949.1 aminofutalosine synthase MqnE [Pseudomonadota bacterium]MBU4475126.1 aminofutalosine synthase MqnE [Pseudomonadota bacterium]
MQILKSDFFDNMGLGDIRTKVANRERLTFDDGMRLFNCPEPLAVGALAQQVRARLHGDKAFYVVNRHINYTNICVNGCAFCAYQREEGQPGGFVLSLDEALARIDASPLPPREIHIVGGCHPRLGLDYFEALLQAIRQRLPEAVLKCFTAVEIAHFARLENIATREVLERLQAAGLGMLPGGGAEIFAPAVRERICPRKSTADQWLAIHEEAHALGIKTNCTMLFGHIEARADRIDHLIRLRESQDRSHGYTCFIPLPFLTENSTLTIDKPLTGLEELRTIAISRLMLDNIPHIKAYWVMLGVKQAQAALKFGADDFDGTVVEEKIGHEAGATSEQGLTRAGLEAMIRGCGCTPIERDAYFNEV